MYISPFSFKDNEYKIYGNYKRIYSTYRLRHKSDIRVAGTKEQNILNFKK